jgi:hypothetical protein
MNFKLFSGILLAFTLLSAKQSGCGSRQNSVGIAKPATNTRPATTLKDKLVKFDLKRVQNMSASLQLSIDQNGQKITANGNLIWIRDSIVWMNVKKFGIEAVRALITKDSVFMLNRLEKTYTAKGLEALQHEYNLPAGFELIQCAILAKAWMFSDVTLQSDLENGLHRLTGNNEQYTARYWMEEGSFLLQKEAFVQKKDSKMISIGFDQYQKLQDNGYFPYIRSIEAFDPETGAMFVQATLSEIEVNKPKSFKFEVPGHYKRVN